MWALIGFSFARARLSALEVSQNAKTATAQRIVQNASERGRLVRKR